MLTAIILTFMMLFSGIAYISGASLPLGSLATVLAPISQAAACRPGPAGIDTLYLVDYTEIDVDNVTYAADEQVSAIPLTASNTWTKIDFQEDTAFFNQEKSIAGRTGLIWTQTISVNFTLNDADTRKKLKDQDGICNLVGLVVDNQGKVRVSGMEAFMSGTKALGLKTDVGSFNSGADSSSDENLRIHSMKCKATYEAPYTTIDVSALSLTP